MITSSLRRAVRSHPSSHSISRPTTPAIAASFSSQSHQRRQSSSKPPIPPSDGSANVANPSVKTVGTPRSKAGTAEKRSGTESRLSRRKMPRDRSEYAADGKDEWAIDLPSVPSTQHLDPKDIFVACFFSNHRPISVTSSVPLSAPEEVFQSIFTSRKPAKSKPGTAEVIYTLASAVQTLDSSIAQSQSPHQNQNQHQQQGQQDRSDLISALTQHNNSSASNASEPQHLDGSSQQNLPLRVPNGVKLAIQQITRQFRPFNPPPAPQPISDAQIEAKEAENAAAAALEAEEQQAQQLEDEIERQDAYQRPQHVIIDVHERVRQRQANRFFTPHTAQIENTSHPQLVHEIEEGGSGMHYDPNANIMDPEPQRMIGRIRHGPHMKSPGLSRRKMYAISVKRQRRLKMKKHKYKKLMRRTRTLRRKLDK